MNSIEKFEENLSEWAYEYCENIEDDPLVRQYITSPIDAFLYCERIKYNEKLAKIARQGDYDI